MELNVTSNNDNHHEETAIVVGNSISIVCVVLVLVTLISSKFLRVKRQNIISINLCFSLLIRYIGSLTSALSGDHSPMNSSDDKMLNGTIWPACITGSVLSFSGHFFVIFWLLLDWLFLSFTVRQRVSRHISRFFIKSAILAYGFGSIVVFIFVIWNHALFEVPSINPHLCWYKLSPGEKFTFLTITGLCLLIIIACAVYCVVKFTCRKVTNVVPSKIKKTKRILYRLSGLTIIITIGSFPSTYALVESEKLDASMNWVFTLDGVLVALEGGVIIAWLVFSAGEIKSHWIAVWKGRDPSINSSLRGQHKTTVFPMQPDNNASSANSGENGEKPTLKIQPRDQQVTFTPDDEVFLSHSREPSPIVSPEKKCRPSTTNSKSEDTAKTNPSGALEKLHSLRNMIGSVGRKPSSVTSNRTPPQSPNSKKGTFSALEKFTFGRQSKVTKELEKKSSF